MDHTELASFAPGNRRWILIAALSLTIVAAAAIPAIDRDRPTTRVATRSSGTNATVGTRELSDGDTASPSSTVDVTTTAPRRPRVPKVRPVKVPQLPNVPDLLDLLPTGWVAFEEPEALVAVRADASHRVTVSQPGEKVLGASWSPITDQIAYLVENSSQLRIVNVDTGAARSFDLGGVPRDYTFAAPLWSPTGAHIAVNIDTALVLVPTLTNGDVRSLGKPLEDEMSFSPDGRFIAGHATGCSPTYCQDQNLIVVRIGADDDRQTIPTTAGFYPRSPLWSSDGTRLAFVVGKDMSATTTAVIGVNGQGEHIVASPDTAGVGLSGASPIAWDPLVPNALFLQRQPTGVRYAVVDGDAAVKTVGPDGPSLPASLSPNGLLVAYGNSCDGAYGACLHTVDRTGSVDRRIVKTSYVGVTYWTANSAAVALREPASDDWSRVVVHSVISDKSWVLSERMPNHVLNPDMYLYPSRALL